MNFFESYFRAAENLSDKDRLSFYDQLFRFFFDGKEEELRGGVAAVWECVKPTVSKTKALSEAGKRGGEKSRKPSVSQDEASCKPDVSQCKAKRKPIISHNEAIDKPCVTEKEKDKEKEKGVGDNTPLNPPEWKRVSATELIEARNMPSILEAATKDWVQYKTEKREAYKPTGLKSLLTEIENNANEYGDSAVVDVIQKSMAAGYKGITWAWLKQPVVRSGTTRVDGLEEFLNGGVT